MPTIGMQTVPMGHNAPKNKVILDKFRESVGGFIKTIKRDEPKIGRNDPCPCNSGKKYKKCCITKEKE